MLTKHLIISTLLVMAAAACGDDGGTVGDACVAHGMCGDGPKITDPDGGNIIFEYIYFDTEMQGLGFPATANRVMAFFTKSQTPENLGQPRAGECNNLVAGKGWPLYEGDAHVDLDVGDLTITGKNAAGADVTLAIPKGTTPKDQIGRAHEIFYQKVNAPADDFITFDSFYTVKFGGAGEVPPTTYDKGLYMSPGYTVTAPGLEENGPLSASAPFTVKWNPAASPNVPMDALYLGVTWLVDLNGHPTHLCPVLQDAGTFTIPATAIAEYRQIATARGTNPDKVILLRNAIVHRLGRTPVNQNPGRRTDFMTVNCWLQLMDVTP